LAPSPLPPRVVERTTPTPPPPRMRQPTTSPHWPPPPFPTACLKPSPSGSVLDFWPQTRRPRLCDQTRHYHTTTTWCTPPYHPSPSLPTAVPYGTPVTEHQRLGFGFKAKNLPARLHDQTRHHHTAIPSYTPPYHLPPSPPTAVSDGAPVTEPQMLGFGLVASNPPPPFA
jgi:hypothetical protein